MSCPMHTSQIAPKVTQALFPNQLSLKTLGRSPPSSAPSSTQIAEYKKDFLSIDQNELKADLVKLMRTSQPWWPNDYGHYGPFFNRLAWHSAGTYRTSDGRGGGSRGNIRFSPLDSWPDNGNLDKARRLLWPLKKKYGKKLSWGDLIIYAGTIGMEDMGMKIQGIAGGRIDQWEPEEDIYWGSETEWLKNERGAGEGIKDHLGAVQMGLIYVNPEGPDGRPDALASAHDIRTTFSRMAMNDVETVALIAGGHTFGKAHGAASPGPNVGAAPAMAPLEEQGKGWKNTYGSGNGADTITSGLEGAWTDNPTKWDNGYFHNLFKYTWKMTKSPAGASQWIPEGDNVERTVPDAHHPTLKHLPVMFTSDLALKFDPAYGPISKDFHDNPEQLEVEFGKAWYKLTHRDMGDVKNCWGSRKCEAQVWQDPVPVVTHGLPDAEKLETLKMECLEACTVSQLVKVALSSSSTYRGTDRRGGSNGARIRLLPQKNWAGNEPAMLDSVLSKLTVIQNNFNNKNGNTQVSMADLIIIGGNAAVESAAKRGGLNITVPYVLGRGDATQEQTEIDSFGWLESRVDGFKNYIDPLDDANTMDAGACLVDRSGKLGLSKSEMTVLVGGLRVLGANVDDSKLGVLTSRPGVLSNDFFVNLIDHTWTKSARSFTGVDANGVVKFTATSADLLFGSNSELRALTEYYAADEGNALFGEDFAGVWGKVMGLGFDEA